MKGDFKDECNRTSCKNGNAIWWNFSTKKYYCAKCAEIINNDPFNKKESLRFLGHELLKKAESENDFN